MCLICKVSETTFQVIRNSLPSTENILYQLLMLSDGQIMLYNTLGYDKAAYLVVHPGFFAFGGSKGREV